jgi:signal transduction histidine kinase
MTRMVLRNLVSNALKFTKTGGRVEISAQSRDNWTEVAVSDNGVGLDAEEIAKLFRLDVSYHRRGTTGEPGSGMGLILCQDMVEKHGGRIWVESQPGQGSVFRFTLPATN